MISNFLPPTGARVFRGGSLCGPWEELCLAEPFAVIEIDVRALLQASLSARPKFEAMSLWIEAIFLG